MHVTVPLCALQSMSFNWREIEIFCFFNTRHLHPNDLHGRQHGVNSGVRLSNHYTRAKLEKILPITSRDIRRFIK